MTERRRVHDEPARVIHKVDDHLPEIEAGHNEIYSAAAVVSDDVLVKSSALDPDATLEPYDHPALTNRFHIQ